MKCVTTVSYRIRVNGELSEMIKPERGLRQGDPLSPYLFLLCAEGFSALLSQAEGDGRLKGVKVCQRAPSVSHLLFADDSLILFRANGGDAQHLQGILAAILFIARASGRCGVAEEFCHAPARC